MIINCTRLLVDAWVLTVCKGRGLFLSVFLASLLQPSIIIRHSSDESSHGCSRDWAFYLYWRSLDHRPLLMADIRATRWTGPWSCVVQNGQITSVRWCCQTAQAYAGWISRRQLQALKDLESGYICRVPAQGYSLSHPAYGTGKRRLWLGNQASLRSSPTLFSRSRTYYHNLGK